MVENGFRCAPSTMMNTVMPTTTAGPMAPRLVFSRMKAATAAQKMPQRLPRIVFLRASVSPPVWKKQAQAIKPAQMASPIFM